MSKNPYSVPIRPDYSAVASAPSRFQQTLIRSSIALVRGIGDGSPAAEVAKRLWPDNRSTLDYIKRGAVTPTTTATSGVPTATIVNALVPLLGPASAIGNLFKRCLNVSFGEASAISIPEITASGSGVAFITQGAPFPIRQLAMAPTPMVVKKLAMGLVLTRELYEHSNAEALLSAVLAADLSLGIETLLFDATAIDTTRPAGLKNGINATAADSGTDVTAMFNDFATLGSIVSAVGATNIAFIASPKQFIKIQMRKSQNNFPYPIWCSSALADKTIACVALDALAVAVSEPRFETSKAATLVMNDVPAEFVTSGGVLGAPVQSLFQSDAIGLRVLCDCDWCLRSSSGFAWMQNVNW
jgi:hypothetical protein